MIMRLPIVAVAGMALVVFAVAGLALVLLIRIRVLAAVLSLPSRCRNTVLALVVVAIAVAVLIVAVMGLAVASSLRALLCCRSLFHRNSAYHHHRHIYRYHNVIVILRIRAESLLSSLRAMPFVS